MRFLADAGVSPKTIEFLAQLGHYAEHVRALGMQRAPDPQIVDRARDAYVKSVAMILQIVYNSYLN